MSFLLRVIELIPIDLFTRRAMCLVQSEVGRGTDVTMVGVLIFKVRFSPVTYRCGIPTPKASGFHVPAAIPTVTYQNPDTYFVLAAPAVATGRPEARLDAKWSVSRGISVGKSCLIGHPGRAWPRPAAARALRGRDGGLRRAAAAEFVEEICDRGGFTWNRGFWDRLRWRLRGSRLGDLGLGAR
jgi:hypothetical protein